MATCRKRANPRRGEIYLTALDPTIGREIRKTRPALIIQNNISNRLSEITIVAPTVVLLPVDAETGLEFHSVALVNQIRAVDRRQPGADSALKIDGLVVLGSGDALSPRRTPLQQARVQPLHPLHGALDREPVTRRPRRLLP
jgi:mRNA interferase MazF